MPSQTDMLTAEFSFFFKAGQGMNKYYRKT